MTSRDRADVMIERVEGGLRWLNARLGAIDQKVDANHQETRQTLATHDAALKEIVPVFQDLAPAVKVIGSVVGSKWVKRVATAFGMALFSALGVNVKSCYELQNIGSNVEVAVDNTMSYDENGEVVTVASTSKVASEQAASAARQAGETNQKLDELAKPKPAPKKRATTHRPAPKPVQQRGFVGEFLDRLFP